MYVKAFVAIFYLDHLIVYNITLYLKKKKKKKKV
jgi:hypothetical protein